MPEVRVPAPTKVAATAAKKERRKSLQDRLFGALTRMRPKVKPGGVGVTMDVSRTKDRVLAKVTHVLTTGIKAFDRIVGPLPFGRIIELYGLEMCGKTAMAIRAGVRANQRHVYERVEDPDDPTKVLLRAVDGECDTTVYYIDNEGSLSDDDKMTVDGTKLDALEAQADTVELLFKSVDKVVENLVQYEKEHKRPQFVVIVVDTVASTSSDEEINQAWGKEDYSRQPKQLRRAFRRIARRIGRHRVLMLCVNQVSDTYAQKARTKSNVPRNSSFATFGGKALKFWASIRVFMYQIPDVNWKYSRESQNPDGILVGFYTSKNRLLMPLREGRMVINLSRDHGGLDDLASMLETLIFLKLAVVSKATYSIGFQFNKNGVKLSTFGQSADADEDDDDDGEDACRNLPQIANRGEFAAFYAAHQADVDALWEVAIDRVFSTSNSPTVAPIDAEDDPDADAEDDDEEDED